MITDKEYPATHSMATAWYMVDTDGNVGLMAFDDNGPVPEFNQVIPDLDICNLAFGQGFSDDEKCEGFHLNLSQIHEICGEPRNPEDINLWYKIGLAVDPEHISEFLLLCKNVDITNYGCIYPQLNIYLIDAFDCVDTDNKSIIAGSTIDKMIKADMIKAFYQVPEWDVNSEYDKQTKSVVFTKNFENAPYYIYCQSYWTSDPQHRMNIPSTPVNISQIDERFRRKMLYVPIRFKEVEDLQIAEWFVCRSNDKVLGINNAGYSLFPIDKHTNKYCLTEPFLIDFFGYCSHKEYYKCHKCNCGCASTFWQVETLTPTILYVVAPTRNRDVIEQINLPQDLKEKMAVSSYIPRFPYHNPRHWIDVGGIKDLMTTEALTVMLSSSKGWFENMVRIINPHVIIIDNEALPVFSEVFPISSNEITINNSKYPVFPENTVKANEAHIRFLAQSPYRGWIFKMSYTEQEVEELKQEGKTFEPY
ncbi:MAG: hypothetical protein K2N05_11960 [Muribaculaceae bacterium]|nr:hypothetical protein [Muribaculaceae bacterium]